MPNSWNWTFYQHQNWKYLQISILLKFPNVSEISIIYRSFKGQKSYKIAKCWNQAFYRYKNRITLNIYIYIYILKLWWVEWKFSGLDESTGEFFCGGGKHKFRAKRWGDSTLQLPPPVRKTQHKNILINLYVIFVCHIKISIFVCLVSSKPLMIFYK